MQRPFWPAAVCAASFLTVAIAAPAATHMVRNTDDSGPGSLRAAVYDAANGDSVLFASDVEGEILLEKPLDLDTPLSLKGPGPNAITLRARGGAVAEVSAVVTLSGLTLAGGERTIIAKRGTLTLIDCSVQDSAGSGIDNRGARLLLLRSAVVRNRGAGIVTGGGRTTCVNSTIAENGGAALVADGGNVTSASCTISGNRGSGIEARDGTVTVQNTVIVGNLQGCTGAVGSGGYNLTDDMRCGLAGPGDVTTDDARIGALGRNGGPTLTAAPTGGSPAIDGGDPGGCADASGAGLLNIDQRGLRRPAGGRCDIGAVETQPIAAGAVVNRILALVDGDPITLYELKDFASGDPRLRQAYAVDQAAVLELLITKHLIEKEVQQHGIVVRDADVDRYIDNIKQRNQIDDLQLDAALEQQGLTRARYRAQVREELERAQLINREIRGKVSVSPEEIARYQKEHGAAEADVPAGGTITISQIFLRLPADAPPDQVAAVEARAAAIAGQLADGADFATLAQRESEDGAANAGGKLGTFKEGELREDLEEAVRGLKVGAVSMPVRGNTGIHIVRVDERTAPGGSAARSDGDAEQIKEQLYAKALEERYNRWLKEDLRQRHHVEIRP